ncbi:MAG: hypothetical protein QXT53_02955 [Ignisphaera sp.]
MQLLDINHVRNLLVQKGFEKVYLIEKEHNCLLFLGEIKGSHVIIGIYRGSKTIYAKIVNIQHVLEPYWKCDYLDYIPYGLYAFSNGIEELVDKILMKINRVLKL